MKAEDIRAIGEPVFSEPLDRPQVSKGFRGPDGSWHHSEDSLRFWLLREICAQQAEIIDLLKRVTQK